MPASLVASGDGQLTIPSRSTPLLAFEEISHDYVADDRVVPALSEINLSIQAGEFVAIVGASGCGKSTLLRIASGLIRPSGGSASFLGQPIVGPTSEIGMIFQDAVMLPWFTVLQNVLLPEKISHSDMTLARARAERLLKDVGLGDFSHSYPGQLSGGMRQRAAIVRALMSRPRLLLMDEPFGALDALTRENMNMQFAEIAASLGCAVLLITHSIPEAVFLADRAIVMTPRPGRIAEEVNIELPRPRTRETMTHPNFTKHCHALRRHFSDNGHTID